MKNFIFISPNFPETYSAFVKELAIDGFRVLTIGDAPYDELNDELKQYTTEYYFANLNNYKEVRNAVQYFINKYGPIDYLESNNEYWLRQDAMLRSEFNIEGLQLSDMDAIQRKSKMKEAFKKANVKFANFILFTNKEKLLEFIDKYGYPIFIKPDIGVGAQENYKISNEKDIEYFLSNKNNKTTYIVEQFVSGDLISFDGMANNESEVVFSDCEHFPPGIADIVKNNGEVCYYCLPSVDSNLIEIGKRIVKAFNLKKRFFHIEFFILNKDIKYLGNKGDYVVLEANMRFPGGYTPDLIDYSQSINIYKLWADIMMFNKSNLNLNEHKYFAVSSNRRDANKYYYSHEEILSNYKNNICKYGKYPNILSDDLGNKFYMAKFETLEEVIEFNNFVIRKIN